MGGSAFFSDKTSQKRTLLKKGKVFNIKNPSFLPFPNQPWSVPLVMALFPQQRLACQSSWIPFYMVSGELWAAQCRETEPIIAVGAAAHFASAKLPIYLLNTWLSTAASFMSAHLSSLHCIYPSSLYISHFAYYHPRCFICHPSFKSLIVTKLIIHSFVGFRCTAGSVAGGLRWD